MGTQLPDDLKQGEVARLFPVLATTSKEGRTTSIVLASMVAVWELGFDLLKSVGQTLGARGKLECYTEVVFASDSLASDRPDGLIVLSNGQKQWRALVEAKIGTATIDPDQVEKYRRLAQDNGIDCVITISNQFATLPQDHPLEQVRKSRSRVPVFHWSWMHILTVADLLLANDAVNDSDQSLLLSELQRFLTHESAGVRGFDRMPPEWSDLNKLISSGGTLPVKSPLTGPVIAAWHQESRDLSLILSRMTGARVSERLTRKQKADVNARVADSAAALRETHCLGCELTVPDAAGPIEIKVDIPRRSIDVGMSLRAPEDRKSTSARLNWLLRQIKTEDIEDVHVRLHWPGKSEATQFPLAELQADVKLAAEGKEHLSPTSFHVFLSKRLGARFTQQVNFISDLESIVPAFYGNVGSALRAHRRKAPALRPDRSQSEDVTPESLAEDAEALTQERGGERS